MNYNILKLLNKDTFYSLEITPPKGSNFDDTLDEVSKLSLDSLIDTFVITDNPLAKLKYSSLFASLKTQKRFNKPTIATISMRDKNKIALQSDLLGLNDFGINSILALTGDPATSSDQPSAKGVFEGNSNLLLDIIECLNSKIDYAGRPISGNIKKINPFAVSNSFAKNPEKLYKKMLKKLNRGAVGIITQPVFDVQNAKMLIELFDRAKKDSKYKKSEPKLILGFFPITRLRTAQFLTSHVPGINVPKSWSEELMKAKEMSDKAEFEKGIELSRLLFRELSSLHPKLHLMSANKFEIIKKVIKG